MNDATAKRYRFGSVGYTLEEIKQTAYRHGFDGIQYYPPSNWGPKPTLAQETMVAYDREFKRGREARKEAGFPS